MTTVLAPPGRPGASLALGTTSGRVINPSAAHVAVIKLGMTLVMLLFATPSFAIPRVIGVVEPQAAIGRTLTLKVDGDPGRCQSLILFIQRSPIHGLVPRCGNGTVAFKLVVNDQNATRWHRILGGHWFTRTVSVGLGPNDQFPFPTLVTDEPFRIIQVWRVVVMFAIALALLSATFLVRRLTTALDSLARMQIAGWVVIIGVSYVYVWSITGETETITPGALALLAIGAGTAVGAKILGTKTRVDMNAIVQGMKNANVTPVEQKETRGLHEIQAAAWTIILAVVFLATVFRLLEMPDFSGNVLAMAGISGGTYVAFSMPQRH
jgi:hypothetical protein